MKKQSKKLSLGTETVRSLDGLKAANLADVAGGSWSSGRTWATKYNCSVGICNGTED
jgi:hypothetical protein